MNLAETRTHEPLINKKKEKKSRKPIKKVAKKRVAVNKEYMKLREQFLKDHPFCQWSILEMGYSWGFAYESDFSEWIRCDFNPYPRSTEIHHVRGRGKYMLDTSTWMAVSEIAHKNIHNNPKHSYEKGYMKPRR